MIFYIYSTHPEFGDEMNRYEWDEMVSTFGQDGAESLRDGVSFFANGGLHVNAAHAAMREAADMLENGE